MIVSLIISNDSITNEATLRNNIFNFKINNFYFRKIGEVNANLLNKPSPKLRKQNRIKTIHSSLRIEGNTLTEEQITALLENKRVIGPKKMLLKS